METTGRRRKIAVVEDDAQICSLVEKVLASGGYDVVATGDPTHAVELIRSEKPDLVLCDIAMPELDGYGVLKALQSDPLTACYPVVFLTAHHEFSERVKAFRFGVVDYLTKPFTRTILLRKLEKVLDTLAQRSGVVTAEGPPQKLLEEVQRDARTGVLTVKGEAGEARVVLRAGTVVETTGTPEAVAQGTAAFTEIDAAREDIVSHDPPQLPGSSGALPSFADIPEVLRKVLVVDDNRVFRRFLSQLFASHGFTVFEAGNGADALALALERRPWLILTDVRMPGEDGFQFCQRVRSHSLIRQTPLLFLSGWDDYKARYHGLELGADDFLSKETSIRELLIRVQLILKRYIALGARGRSTGMEGQLQVMGAPGVLQMCHLTRLTGVLAVESGTRRMSVRFREGEIVGATGEGKDGEEAVYELLSWEHGSFQFRPGDPGDAPPLGRAFNEIVLEGCRRLDEAQRTDGGRA